MAMATGLAVLNAIKNENLLANVKARGEQFQTAFKELATEFGCIGNVRGRGLMLGIEIVDEHQPKDHIGSYPADSKLAMAIQTACFNN